MFAYVICSSASSVLRISEGAACSSQVGWELFRLRSEDQDNEQQLSVSGTEHEASRKLLASSNHDCRKHSLLLQLIRKDERCPFVCVTLEGFCLLKRIIWGLLTFHMMHFVFVFTDFGVFHVSYLSSFVLSSKRAWMAVRKWVSLAAPRKANTRI